MAKKQDSLASRLRRIREKEGLSSYALAAQSGVAASMLSRIESGQTTDPRLSTLRAIAAALGCSLDSLAGE